MEKAGSAIPPLLHKEVGNSGNGLLRDLGAVDLGEVRGDLPVREPYRGQGNDHLIDRGQPPLTFGEDFRLEAGMPVQRHADIHRAGMGNYRLGPVAVAGIAAVAAFRVILSVGEMVIQLAFQCTLDHDRGQAAQQPALAGQLQPAGAGPSGQLAQHLLIGDGELSLGPVPVLCT